MMHIIALGWLLMTVSGFTLRQVLLLYGVILLILGIIGGLIVLAWMVYENS